MYKSISEALSGLKKEIGEAENTRECYKARKRYNDFIAKLEHNRIYLDSEEKDDAVFYVFRNGDLVETTTDKERARIEVEKKLKK